MHYYPTALSASDNNIYLVHVHIKTDAVFSSSRTGVCIEEETPTADPPRGR